mgnify:CR=1 FL=1
MPKGKTVYKLRITSLGSFQSATPINLVLLVQEPGELYKRITSYPIDRIDELLSRTEKEESELKSEGKEVVVDIGNLMGLPSKVRESIHNQYHRRFGNEKRLA